MGVCAGKQKRAVNKSNRRRKRERRRLLVGREEAPPTRTTTLYDLPMEVLDIILQKSYLHWILNTKTKQRDEDVIRSLISVDVCFNRRITRKRFKKAIWRYLKIFYGRTKKRSAVIRNNRNYLLENIQPNNDFISLLLSLNCVTEEQCYCIQRQRSKRNKNAELLKIMRSFNEAKFSNLVKCLRQTNQTDVAGIVSKGGVVVKVIVINCGGEFAGTVSTQLIHQKMDDLRSRINLESRETNECVSQLRNKGIEILNFQLDRHTVVVWIWCPTQEALKHIQNLCESNQMKKVFFDHIQPSNSMVLSSESNQFKKTNVVYSMSISITQRIELRVNKYAWGVTKLRNQIFVLCHYADSTVINVFVDRYPFRFWRKIEIKQFNYAFDIWSSEKENCIYVFDTKSHCVWKITKEEGKEHKVMKWLTIDQVPNTISVSTDGNLLMVNASWPILTIYGSDATFIRSIYLPTDIERAIHAVETSMGNFIILHAWKKNAGHWSDVRDRKQNWAVSELTRDGQAVIRCFIPANEAQELNYPSYISLDSDDRVFVADSDNDRVILLGSDLEWNQIIWPSLEELKVKIRLPRRLCYDKEENQLIAVGCFGDVWIYTLSQH